MATSTLSGIKLRFTHPEAGPVEVPLNAWPVLMTSLDATTGAIVANKASADGSPVAPSNNLAVTDKSGAITTGGTAQDAVAAGLITKYVMIQNISAEDMWFNFGATAAAATAGSFKLVAGQAWQNPPHFSPSGRLSVVAASTGSKFTCKIA